MALHEPPLPAPLKFLLGKESHPVTHPLTPPMGLQAGTEQPVKGLKPAFPLTDTSVSFHKALGFKDFPSMARTSCD